MPSAAIQKLLETAERCLGSGYIRRADDAYQRAIKQDPSSADAWLGWADVARRGGRADEALHRLQQAVTRIPDDPRILHALGQTLAQLGRLPQAIEQLRRSVKRDPARAEAWDDLGRCLLGAGSLDDAIVACERAVRLRPDALATRKMLAVALGRRGRLAESLAEFDRSLEVDPNDARCHLGRATALLLAGRWRDGFAEYEWRRRLPEFPTLARTMSGTEWDGADPAGKTVLLFSEQGFGDVVHFIRYAPLLADRGATVLVEVQPELVSLVRSVRGVSRVFARGEPLPPFDAHASLMSLPHWFGTTLETVPADVPYIAPDDAAVREWAGLLPPSGSLRVGLTWAGNPKDIEGLGRSLSFDRLRPVLDVPGVSWVALQKGANEADLARHAITSLGPRLRDFADTAAVVSQLDLVISVDTALAHVAGALAKPTWVLLPSEPDFRWMLSRDDSPWYPTMRLFRQDGTDWDSVVRRVAEALRERVAGHTSGGGRK